MPNFYTHSFYAWFLHTFPPCLILAHIRINKIPYISSSFFFFSSIPKKPSLLWQVSMTFLELVPLIQWKRRNPFAPIHGLLILQGPMKIWAWIAIQLKLGWESLGSMKHKNYSILQSKRKTILMTNGIGGFILPLYLGYLDEVYWAWSLSFPSVDPHILLLHPNYFK